MKKLFYLLIIFGSPAMLFAQKNVVPALQTQMLGIQLPEGSKQDKRLLSVAASDSFLSMSTEYKKSEITPVEVYSIPAASGFNLENIRVQLTANGYGNTDDKGDNKLLWFTKDNSNWLVYVSQENKETALYIGKGNMGKIIPGNTTQPVLGAGTNSGQANNNNSAGKYPAYIPPLAGRQTGALPQKTQENEGQMFVHDLDGNRYAVLQIGKQFWMKENLRTTQYNDTTKITTGLNAQDWEKAKHGAYAVYDDKPGNIKKYGLLYNGHAAASGKLCPKGWHVATDSDWKELEQIYGISESELERTGERGNIANKLKTTNDWKPSSFSSDNSSGFSILPAGARLDNGEYSTLNQYGNFWTSTVYDDRYGLLYLWNHHVHYNTNAVGRIYTVANNGYSCRCVKDKLNNPSDNKK
ncbi:fibrobacter succinogenes major paralogous domain-containing protein [Aquiflexum sp.]|uniref:fibrobacter succinogenes major paralogous domain-containing protein n=1 Tax=Aquiflexum sp. TaxID=1872584 RepID=UPI0035942488